jgi:hypothetical protein
MRRRVFTPAEQKEKQNERAKMHYRKVEYEWNIMPDDMKDGLLQEFTKNYLLLLDSGKVEPKRRLVPIKSKKGNQRRPRNKVRMRRCPKCDKLHMTTTKINHAVCLECTKLVERKYKQGNGGKYSASRRMIN